MKDKILDYLIVFNSIYALLLLIITFCANKVKNIFYNPILFNISISINLAVTVAVTCLVLIKGTEIDDKLLKIFYSIIIDSEKGNFIDGLVMLYLAFTISLLLVPKPYNHGTIRFLINSLEAKLIVIDKEYSNGVTSFEEISVRIEELKKKMYFFVSLDEANKFLFNSELFRIIIIFISFIGVILIGILRYIFKGKSISDAINISFPFIISSGILCMLPSLMLSITMRIIIARLRYANKKEINNESEQN